MVRDIRPSLQREPSGSLSISSCTIHIRSEDSDIYILCSIIPPLHSEAVQHWWLQSCTNIFILTSYNGERDIFWLMSSIEDRLRGHGHGCEWRHSGAGMVRGHRGHSTQSCRVYSDSCFLQAQFVLDLRKKFFIMRL